MRRASDQPGVEVIREMYTSAGKTRVSHYWWIKTIVVKAKPLYNLITLFTDI